VGEQLGEALVEAGEGVAQAVGCEDLAPRAPSLPVDLDRLDGLALEGADVPCSAAGPARPHRLAAERERLAERRESLDPDRRVPRLHKREQPGEQSLTAVGSRGGMVDDLAAIRELGSDRI